MLATFSPTQLRRLDDVTPLVPPPCASSRSRKWKTKATARIWRRSKKRSEFTGGVTGFGKMVPPPCVPVSFSALAQRTRVELGDRGEETADRGAFLVRQLGMKIAKYNEG